MGSERGIEEVEQGDDQESEQRQDEVSVILRGSEGVKTSSVLHLQRLHCFGEAWPIAIHMIMLCSFEISSKDGGASTAMK